MSLLPRPDQSRDRSRSTEVAPRAEVPGGNAFKGCRHACDCIFLPRGTAGDASRDVTGKRDAKKRPRGSRPPPLTPRGFIVSMREGDVVQTCSQADNANVGVSRRSRQSGAIYHRRHFSARSTASDRNVAPGR